MAAFAQALFQRSEHRVDDVYLTEQVTPLYKWMASRFPTLRIVGSEYHGAGVRAGEVRDGIPHQDLERLGFESASFDMVLSCDVLEHVNEPQAALGEMARVLRPGGSLLFTVPFLWHAQANRRRARIAGGTIEHLAAPSYHGNPMDPNGSLAFFDYGWELLDWVRDAGFRDVSVLCYWSAALAHLGAGLEIFHAQR
jgi:SAM-dependent methyltransferase